MTRWRKTCNSGCVLGSLVTSKRGSKMSKLVWRACQRIPPLERSQIKQVNILRTTSPKLSTVPLALKTSYNRGIWISHRTLSEKSLLLTTHLASLSHSPLDLLITHKHQYTSAPRAREKFDFWRLWKYPTFRKLRFYILPFDISSLVNRRIPLIFSTTRKISASTSP